MGNRGEPNYCPVFKPTKEEFSRPFCEFVKKVLKKTPDIPMFKIIPPAGWRPRAKPFPPLERIRISTPIKQHVFGTKGVYRCMLVEHKEMSAAEFRTIANDDDHKLPKCERGEESTLSERAFWSQVTLKPPLYGADTPTSFFDDRLPYGWNVRNLGDLLCTTDVPAIPGVTTPMTYFGMWRSFFAWHVEDADLYSINYLHFGAAKVWYCVSPKDRMKFERLAQCNFPQLHKACPAFCRHKDILISPSVLHSHGIDYVQAKQQEGEFMVLNAGAFHSGFNLGFNCAEAINFATEEWLPLGQVADHCTCDALRDSVRIDMSHFGLRRLSEGSEEDEDESEEEFESASSGEEAGGSGASDESGSRQYDSEGEEVASCSQNSDQPPVPKKRGRPFGSKNGVSAKRLKAGEATAAPMSAPVKGGAGRPKLDTGGTPKGRPGTSTPPSVLPRVSHDAMATAPPRLDFSEEPAEKPQAIVGEDHRGKKWFTLVLQDRTRKPAKKGWVVLQRLDEGKDQLWRPSGSYQEEKQGALVPVRSQWLGTRGARKPGFKLLTLRSKVLDTELHD